MTTPPEAAPMREDVMQAWQAAWDALPDGMHAYTRARQAGIDALALAHTARPDANGCNCVAAGVAHVAACFTARPDAWDEVERLKHVIDRDRYIAAAALNAIEAVTRGRSWLSEAGRGSYAYDDERYQAEFGMALEEIDRALLPLRKLAKDKTDCTTDPEKVQACRDASIAAMREGVDRGMVEVPRVMTPAMIDAGWKHVTVGLTNGDENAIEKLWTAMLNAAALSRKGG